MAIGDEAALSIAAGPRAGLGPFAGMTLTEALAARVARCPEARFVSLNESGYARSQSYAALWSRSGHLAAALTALDLPPGSPVVLLTEDGLDFIPAFWACLRAGHTAVPLMSAAGEFRTKGSAPAFAAALTLVSPAAVIADAGFRDVARAELPGCPCLDPEESERVRSLAGDVAPAATVLLLPTSGTTGRLKLVALSQTALLYRAFTGQASAASAGTHVGVFPLDSTTGMRCALMQRHIWIRLPMSAVVRKPERFLDVLAQFRASDTSITNTVAEMILAACETASENRDLSALKQVGLGAETVVLSTVRRLDALLQRLGAAPRPVRAGYGTTETGLLVTGADPLASGGDRHAAARLGSCAPNVEIRIVDDAGLIVPEGATGNIEVRCDGPIFSGYRDDPHPDADGFPANGFLANGFLADGWWRTGDTGHLVGGQLILQGRTKDIVVVNGRKVSLAAIDEALAAALPDARAYACAIRPDGAPAERLAVAVTGAGIVMEAGTVMEEGTGLSPEAVARVVRETVGHAFGLAVEAVVQLAPRDIPTTATGKVSRRALAALILPQTTASETARSIGGTDPEPQDAKAALRSIWEGVLGAGSATDPDADFYGLGGESLRSLQLFSQLNARFGTRIDPREFYRRPTLARLMTLLDMAPAPSEAAPSEPAPSKAAPSEPAPFETAPTDEPDIWPLTAHEHRSLLVFVETWHGRRLTTDRLMVSFNTDGLKPPLFFVCQVEFEIRDLAMALGPDQPVHGFRSGHMVAAQKEREVQAFALRFVADLQEIYPEGPVLLAGTCQGGVIAQAMAEHLLRRERDVPLLALIDWGFRLRPYPGRVLFLYGQNSDFSSPYRRFREPERAWSRGGGEVAAVAVPVAAYRELFDASHVARTAAILADACARALARPPLRLPIEGRRAAIRLVSPPERMTAGQPLTIAVGLSNRGAHAWQETERSGLMLGNYWVDAAGHTVSPADGRLPLREIATGETAELALSVTAPRDAGRYLLVVDVVEEGSAWFDPARGHGVATTVVDVDPSAALGGADDRVPAPGEPHLVIDGRITCGRGSGDAMRFSVPAHARSVRLVSPTTAAPPPDIRTLGVLVDRIAVEAHGQVREIALDDPALSTGFFASEGVGRRTWRWTTGDAVIPPVLWADLQGDVVLRLEGLFSPGS